MKQYKRTASTPAKNLWLQYHIHSKKINSNDFLFSETLTPNFNMHCIEFTWTNYFEISSRVFNSLETLFSWNKTSYFQPIFCIIPCFCRKLMQSEKNEVVENLLSRWPWEYQSQKIQKKNHLRFATSDFLVTPHSEYLDIILHAHTDVWFITLTFVRPNNKASISHSGSGFCPPLITDTVTVVVPSTILANAMCSVKLDVECQ